MEPTLGRSIRAARQHTHKTLRGLAHEAGISPALLSLIEQDNHVPRAELVTKLASMLGGDPDRWCALMGRLTPETEAHFAAIAKDHPEELRYLRALTGRKGG